MHCVEKRQTRISTASLIKSASIYLTITAPDHMRMARKRLRPLTCWSGWGLGADMLERLGPLTCLERLGPLTCFSGCDRWHVRAVGAAGMLEQLGSNHATHHTHLNHPDHSMAICQSLCPSSLWPLQHNSIKLQPPQPQAVTSSRPTAIYRPMDPNHPSSDTQAHPLTHQTQPRTPSTHQTWP